MTLNQFINSLTLPTGTAHALASIYKLDPDALLTVHEQIRNEAQAIGDQLMSGEVEYDDELNSAMSKGAAIIHHLREIKIFLDQDQERSFQLHGGVAMPKGTM